MIFDTRNSEKIILYTGENHKEVLNYLITEYPYSFIGDILTTDNLNLFWDEPLDENSKNKKFIVPINTYLKLEYEHEVGYELILISKEDFEKYFIIVTINNK
jgi:hypothetical protein